MPRLTLAELSAQPARAETHLPTTYVWSLPLPSTAHRAVKHLTVQQQRCPVGLAMTVTVSTQYCNFCTTCMMHQQHCTAPASTHALLCRHHDGSATLFCVLANGKAASGAPHSGDAHVELNSLVDAGHRMVLLRTAQPGSTSLL